MALQPIDLSTVYSQMDKVAKYNASQAQNTQIVSELSQERFSQENLQKAHTVSEAAKNEADSPKIKNDAHGSSQNAPYGNSRRKSQKEEENSKKVVQITDPRLGQHIDITR